ncbi:MAG TPA: two-component system activity regulator YycH [Bacilli bacterium]
MEKAKTVLLTVLVCTSLLQSYLLAYSTPHFESIKETQYIETKTFGTQEKIDNLIFPQRIILHFGGDKHTVLYPGMTFFEMIYNTLRKERTFEGLRLNNVLDYDWETIRKNDKGVEIRFDSGIPLNVLRGVLQIKGDALYDDDSIDNIWLDMTKNQEVHIFLFSQNTSSVYEAVNANISAKDIATFVGFGTHWAETGHSYHTLDGNVYLPDQDLQINRIRFTYTLITPEQMENSLFADPAITRNIREKDGTEIYTDGKRGMQIHLQQHWLVFSDSIAPLDSSHNAFDDLSSAVLFINQHGGWNGKYNLSSIRNNKDGAKEIVFYQYARSFPEYYPIVKTKDETYGFIRTVVQKGSVSDYERSLINLDQSTILTQVDTLIGGKKLDEMVKTFPYYGQLKSVFPAYRPELGDDDVSLVPAWAVEWNDGTLGWLQSVN